MGAWIEIFTLTVQCLPLAHVAPHMGAWIEIIYHKWILVSFQSHPTWVRGLKYLFFPFI